MAIRAARALLVPMGLASPAVAEDCRLALVLALDISGSVDEHEDRLQREGLGHFLPYETRRITKPVPAPLLASCTSRSKASRRTP